MKLVKLSTVLATAGVALIVGMSAAKAQELRFSWWGGDERHKATFEIINKFQEANPGVTIKGEPAANAGYLERLTTQYAGGAEPDIIQMDWSYLWMFSKRGDGFVDLNTLKNVIKLDAFTKTDLAQTTVDGKLNALPYGFSARLFVYNSDPWKKAGIEYPKTWDDLIKAAGEFQSKLGPDFHPLDNNRLDWLLLTHMWATQKFGTTFISSTEPKINYTREQLVEWMTMLKKLPEQKVSVPLPVRVSIGGTAEKESQEIQQWVSGQWGGNYTWDSVTPLRASTLPNKLAQVEIGPMIMMQGAKTSGTIGRPGMIFGISKHSKNPEIAAKFLNFMLTTPEAARITKLSRGVPPTAAQFETLVSEGLIPDVLAKAIDQIRDLREKRLIPPASPWFEIAKIRDPMRQIEEQVTYDKITPEQAADKILSDITPLLARM